MTVIQGTGPLTGPLILGHLLGCILFGILTMQVHSYCNTFTNDKIWIKWLVGILFLLEIIVVICALINAWATFGTGWGDVNSLRFYDRSLIPISLLSSIIASIVQFFFAYRIFKLTNNVWLPIIICVISSLQCVVSFYVGITNAIRGRGFETFYRLSTFASVSLVADAVCDILIAISTVIILVKTMRHSHFRETHTNLKRLIRLSVETGLITASCATVELVLWQAEKHLNYHYIFFLILGKLYSNALMAALNSRALPENQNILTSMSMNMRNHLTLFHDEYPVLSPTVAVHPTSINVTRKVDVMRDTGYEMAVRPPKRGCDEMDSTISRASDTNI